MDFPSLPKPEQDEGIRSFTVFIDNKWLSISFCQKKMYSKQLLVMKDSPPSQAATIFRVQMSCLQKLFIYGLVDC